MAQVAHLPTKRAFLTPSGSNGATGKALHADGSHKPAQCHMERHTVRLGLSNEQHEPILNSRCTKEELPTTIDLISLLAITLGLRVRIAMGAVIVPEQEQA